ncbi:MAG: corrinoid protein [Dehalococcoidales bacterium]|nr:corrinoid protein [Dehalococcoidales bacterium]
MADLNAIYEAVIEGDAPKVKGLTEQAVADGEDAQKVLQESLIRAMSEVGRRMKAQEFYVPEVLIAARAMQWGLGVLKPLLAGSGLEPVGTVAIGTVKSDLHDIGKNLVGMMLEGAGFEVIDLGTDVMPEKFLAAVKDKGANVIGMSALLTTTMPNMKKAIDALKEAGLRDQVKVLVGGAPVTQRYADEIGADAYAPDASTAVDAAKAVLRAG